MATQQELLRALRNQYAGYTFPANTPQSSLDALANAGLPMLTTREGLSAIGRGEVNAPQTTQQTTQPKAYSTYSGGGGGGYTAPETPAAPTFTPVYYGGKWYSEPAPLADARISNYKGSYNKQISSGKSAYKRNVSALNENQTDTLEGINRDRESSMGGLRNFYASASPDAYQSAQGTNEAFVGAEAQRNQTKATNAFKRAIQQAAEEWAAQQESLKGWLNESIESARNSAVTAGASMNDSPMPKVKVSMPTVNYNPDQELKALRETGQKTLQGYGTNEEFMKAINTKLTAGQPLTPEEDAALQSYLYGGM